MDYDINKADLTTQPKGFTDICCGNTFIAVNILPYGKFGSIATYLFQLLNCKPSKCVRRVFSEVDTKCTNHFIQNFL